MASRSLVDPGPLEEAGAREAFEDAPLYDFEYRRRRADVIFYRRLAHDRMSAWPRGPVLDLACGTGRLLVPLLQDGHTVVGIDRSAPMLARAAWRVSRLSSTRRARIQLVRADLRAFALESRFALAIAAFHSVQHLVSETDLVRFFQTVRASLAPDGWFAFDVLPPDAKWIGRDPSRRWARTVFRHPITGERLVYTTNHRYDRRRRALHMSLYYLPIDDKGNAIGPERVVRLCHRQLWPADIKRLLDRTGFRLLEAFGGFDGRAQSDADDEHVYIARAR